MVKLITVAIIALVMVIPAFAEDSPDLERLRHEALKGVVEAQYELGILYEYGFNLQEHRAPALAWYTLAARAGHTLAAQRRDALKAGMKPNEQLAADKLIEEFTQNPVSPPATPSAEVN